MASLKIYKFFGDMRAILASFAGQGQTLPIAESGFRIADLRKSEAFVFINPHSEIPNPKSEDPQSTIKRAVLEYNGLKQGGDNWQSGIRNH
jgi:hypothetical protein